ncbi:MAG: PEP-CTERM sorting domain-containing protein [Capsulimonas sp.]|uniref:PEP-CTERM sorting domain-containing protein n=1 Tax=Capsulimonas sp. TaxID=2494211 RepID=UPI003264B343
MKRQSSRVLSTLAVLGSLCLAAEAHGATLVFGFDGKTVGDTVPFTLTDGGLSATFTGTGNAVSSGFFFGDPHQVLLGATDPLDITFSAPIDNVSSVFYGARGSTVILTAYNGGVFVGSVDTVVPGLGQGNKPVLDFLNFSGSAFDEITLTNFVALNDVSTNVRSAVPEPSSFAALGFGVLGVMALGLRRKHALTF